MKTIFDTCKPRDEVLSGELKEQQFAASLTKVLRGTADAVYGDADDLLCQHLRHQGTEVAAARGAGPAFGQAPGRASVIRLETSFGGGKTHNLIALYHSATARWTRRRSRASSARSSCPSRPIKKIAGIVGPDIDVADGVDHGDVRTFTLWGELAYQLGYRAGGHEGGRAAYEEVRKSDEQTHGPQHAALGEADRR